MRRVLAAFILVAPTLSGAAFAQAQCSALLDQGCACAVPLEALRGNEFGELNPIVGDVLLTRTSGSHAVTSVENVNVGDGVVVLENGKASLKSGPSCLLQLPAQSSLVIRAVEGCACASLVEVQRVAQSQNLSVPGETDEDTEEDSGKRKAGLALAAAGAAAIAAAAALALAGGDDDGNPVTP